MPRPDYRRVRSWPLANENAYRGVNDARESQRRPSKTALAVLSSRHYSSFDSLRALIRRQREAARERNFRRRDELSHWSPGEEGCF